MFLHIFKDLISFDQKLKYFIQKHASSYKVESKILGFILSWVYQMVSGRKNISKNLVAIRTNQEPEVKLRLFSWGQTQIGRYLLKMVLFSLKFAYFDLYCSSSTYDR